MLNHNRSLVGRQQRLMAGIMGELVLDATHVHAHRRLAHPHPRRQLLFRHYAHDVGVYDTEPFCPSLLESTLHFLYLTTRALALWAR